MVYDKNGRPLVKDFTEDISKLEDSISELTGGESFSREPKRYNVLQYNIGNFGNGYNGNDLTGYIADWATFIGKCNADICLFSESRKFIDRGDSIESMTALYTKLYPYASKYGNINVPWEVAMLTNVEQANLDMGLFVNQQNSLSKYIAGEITLNGVDILLMSVHLVHGGSAATEVRYLQMQKLIDMASDYDNVIIGGDFNTQDITEMNKMVEAGFTIGNGGLFNVFLTQEPPTPEYPVDNVCIKGDKIKFQSFKALYDCALSDHYPTLSTLLIG